MKQKKVNGSGVHRLLKATRCSLQGMQAAWCHEAAFRQEIMLCGILAPLALWLGKTGVERALLLGCLIILLIVELLNSAVEAVVDRVGLEQHALSGRAKDLASAAVTLALVHVVATWLFVLL